MKKMFKYIINIIFILVLIFSNSNVTIVNAENNLESNINLVKTLSSTYYSSVENKTGEALLNGLADLSESKHTKFTSYDDLRTEFFKSDKVSSSSTKVKDFYSGHQVASSWNGDVWNREHVWCTSLTNELYSGSNPKYAGADIHHLRLSYASINQSRSNSLFGEIKDSGVAKYYNLSTGSVSGANSSNGIFWGYIDESIDATTASSSKEGVFEPKDDVKGDVARIVLYMYMHYSKEVSANSTYDKAGNLLLTNIVYTPSKTKEAALNLLMRWHNSDPVDEGYEVYRNEYCYGLTGVRNPFIDNPEYVDAIWGDSTSSGGSSSGDNPSTGGNNSGSSSGTTTETITVKKYRQLKSANGITVGSKIAIAAKDYNYALSTEQKTNNRGQTSISKYVEGNYSYLDISSNTQILEVKEELDGAYSLYTGEGYLAATSSSENKLTTKSSLGSGKNAYWKINFTNGAAQIVSNGSYTRNTIRYNATSSLFSCYAQDNNQKDVVIYKEYEEKITVEVPGSDYQYPEAESLVSISKAIEIANNVGETFTSNKYKISGYIESISNDTYGNMTIKDDKGSSIYVYGVYNNDGTLKYGELENPKPVVGDKITLLGVLGMYGSTPEMKSGWIVDWVDADFEKIADNDTQFSLSFDYRVTYKDNTSYIDTFSNVGILFGASVDSTLFTGYKVTGGVLIDNAANYVTTTIAEEYNKGNFTGIKTYKENLTIVNGCYEVGSLIEVVSGVVDETNNKYLNYEFVAAAYFILIDTNGKSTTVVLKQKSYSVKTMLQYYVNNSLSLNLDTNTIEAVTAFNDYI